MIPVDFFVRLNVESRTEVSKFEEVLEKHLKEIGEDLQVECWIDDVIIYEIKKQENEIPPD